MKVIKKSLICESLNRVENLINELRILECVRNPYVVDIYQLLHDKENIYIVSELIKSGDLLNYLDKHKNLSEKEVIIIAK